MAQIRFLCRYPLNSKSPLYWSGKLYERSSETCFALYCKETAHETEGKRRISLGCVKRLGGALVFCLLAMLAAEAVRLVAHDKAWAQEPTPVVVVQATPTPAPTPVPTGNLLLDLWQNADVRKLIIAGVIGAIIALVFQRVLPWLWRKGGQLLSRLVGALGFEGGWQSRRRYLQKLISQHRYLKLVGVGGESDLQQPKLGEVFVSLQMGTNDNIGFRCVVRVAPIGLQRLAKVPHVYGRADSAVRRTTDRFLVGTTPTE